MDDTQKQQAQQPTATGTVMQFPHVSVPTVAKETEPIPSSPKPVEFIKPVEAPIEISPDVEAAGVKEITKTPIIPEEVRQMGVQQAASNTPVSTNPSGFIKLPMTQQQAQAQTKGNFLFKNPSESILWLAMLIVRQFQMKEKEKLKG